MLLPRIANTLKGIAEYFQIHYPTVGGVILRVAVSKK